MHTKLMPTIRYLIPTESEHVTNQQINKSTNAIVTRRHHAVVPTVYRLCTFAHAGCATYSSFTSDLITFSISPNADAPSSEILFPLRLNMRQKRAHTSNIKLYVVSPSGIAHFNSFSDWFTFSISPPQTEILFPLRLRMRMSSRSQHFMQAHKPDRYRIRFMFHGGFSFAYFASQWPIVKLKTAKNRFSKSGNDSTFRP